MYYNTLGFRWNTGRLKILQMLSCCRTSCENTKLYKIKSYKPCNRNSSGDELQKLFLSSQILNYASNVVCFLCRGKRVVLFAIIPLQMLLCVVRGTVQLGQICLSVTFVIIFGTWCCYMFSRKSCRTDIDHIFQSRQFLASQ